MLACCDGASLLARDAWRLAAYACCSKNNHVSASCAAHSVTTCDQYMVARTSGQHHRGLPCKAVSALVVSHYMCLRVGRARQIFVEKLQWVTSTVFLELLALAQCLPGPTSTQARASAGHSLPHTPRYAALTGPQAVGLVA